MTSFFKQSGYKRVNSGISLDWVRQSDTEPVINRDIVAYGWIIRGEIPQTPEVGGTPLGGNINAPIPESPGGSVMTPEGTIDQALLVEQRSQALHKLIAFFDKENSQEVFDLLLPHVYVHDVQQTSRPLTPVSFYVLIDARVFDNARDSGRYRLAALEQFDTLQIIVERYKDFFQITNNTDMGKRARIAELLIANNIDLETATDQTILEWIAAVNIAAGYDIAGAGGFEEEEQVYLASKFYAGAEIYIPTVSDTLVHTGAPNYAVLPIGDIGRMIDAVNITLSHYANEIKSFGGTVNGLNLNLQVELLETFKSALRQHFGFNGINLSDHNADKVSLYMNEFYEVQYVELNQGGAYTPLPRGVAGFASTSPFNDPTTMAIIASLFEIEGLTPEETPWQVFVESYIYPAPEISNQDPSSVYEQLQQDAHTIVDQLAETFGTTSIRSQEEASHEIATMENAGMMQAASAQQSELSHYVGNPVVDNLARYGRQMGAAGGGRGAIDEAYQLVLNRLGIGDLMNAAIQCLKQQFPITCEDLLEAMFDTSFPLAHAQFKIKLPASLHYMADHAYQMASTGVLMQGSLIHPIDYTLMPEAAGFSGRSTFQKYSQALKYALSTVGGEYHYTKAFDATCAYFYNPKSLVSDLFKIPLFFFPDKLPVVDYLKDIAKALEAAIMQMLVGVIVQLVQMLIDAITNACGTLEENYDVEGFGEADLNQALAAGVGAENQAEVLGDLLDSLGAVEPSPVVPAGAPLDATNSMDTQNYSTAGAAAQIAAKCDAMSKLLGDLSTILTPSEMGNLFAGTASTMVLEAILHLIKLRHPLIYEKVNTIAGVMDLFAKLENLVDMSAILNQIVTISNGLGCVFETKCADPPFDGPPPYNPLLPPPDPSQWPTGSDIFCQDRGSSTDNGLIPRNNPVILWMVDKTLEMMYDPVYMAYDSEALRIGDAMYTRGTIDKEIPRTIDVGSSDGGGSISFPVFNVWKLQEEDFEFDFPDWFGKNEADQKKMNPEFQRLLATGYIPVDGTVDGLWGPYTSITEKPGWDKGGTGWGDKEKSLPPVTVAKTEAKFAMKSTLGLQWMSNVILQTGPTPYRSDRFASFTLDQQHVQPNSSNGGLRFHETIQPFTLKYTLWPSSVDNEYNNLFTLEVGEMPVDPTSILGLPMPGDSAYSPTNTAMYRTNLVGEIYVDTEITQVLNMISSENGGSISAAGDLPQVESLGGYIKSVSKNAFPAIGQALPLAPSYLESFAKRQIYPDLNSQILGMIGQMSLNSPLLKYIAGTGQAMAGDDRASGYQQDPGIPVLQLIDWAPITTEEENGCGFDPHILSLETIKYRTREAYDDRIECSPMEDEISVDGLGRKNMSALETAAMTGNVMTTVRAYALEQLIRAMFPVSIFEGDTIVSELMVEYVAQETLRGINTFGGTQYLEIFLSNLELAFNERMQLKNPFGNIPKVIEESTALGVNWFNAENAIKEYNGEITTADLPQIPTPPFQGGAAYATTGQCPPGAATSTDTAVAANAASQRLYYRFRFMVEEQLRAVIIKLQDLIAVRGTLPFDEALLTKGMPLFNVQKEPGEMRFGLKGTNLRTLEMEALNAQYQQYYLDFAKWEEGRLGQLIAGYTGVIGGTNIVSSIVTGVGAGIGCLGGAIVSSFTDDEAQDAEEEWGGEGTWDWISDAWDATTDWFGAVGETIAGCAEEAWETPGRIAMAMMELMTDAPEPAESFLDGVDLYTTDQLGNVPTYTRRVLDPSDGIKNYMSNFHLTGKKGALILEKYIKVKREGAYDFDTTTTQPVAPSVDDADTFDAGSVSGPSLSEILCPRERLNSSAREGHGVQASDNLPIGALASVSIIPNIDSTVAGTNAQGKKQYREQVYNLEEFEMMLRGIADDSSGDTKISDVFTEVSMGLRLVYVAPTNDFEQVGIVSIAGTAGNPDAVGEECESTLKVVPPFMGAFETVDEEGRIPFELFFDEDKERASRCYRQFERTTAEKKIAAIAYESPNAGIWDAAHTETGHLTDEIVTLGEKEAADAYMAELHASGMGWEDWANIYTLGNWGETPLQWIDWPERDDMLTAEETMAQIDATQSFQDVIMERALYLFPLSDVAIPLDIDPDTLLKNVLSYLEEKFDMVESNAMMGQGASVGKELDGIWTFRLQNDLLLNLKRSAGYKYAMKYVTNADNLLSYGCIYSSLCSELPSGMFDGTKRELKKLMNILLNGGDYSYKTEDEKTKGSNRQLYAYAQANIGTDGAARQPALFEMAMTTPKLIFKGLAEFADPVIAPAAAIVKAGKAGLFLPQALKNEGASPDSERDNYMINVTVGKYDIPPPIGAIPPNFGISNRSADGPGASEGLSNDPAENITFQMATFNFKDARTGESMAPFLRAFYDETINDPIFGYELSRAMVQFDFEKITQMVVNNYQQKVSEDPCSPGILHDAAGLPIMPVPILIYPGQKLNLPVSAIAMATLPMDVMMGFGIGPPHTPMGWIYHALAAGDGINSLSFPSTDEKTQWRKVLHLNNKKNLGEKLCINVDKIRDEEETRRTTPRILYDKDGNKIE